MDGFRPLNHNPDYFSEIVMQDIDLTHIEIDKFDVCETGNVIQEYLQMGDLRIKLTPEQQEKIRFYFENT
jgi:hypothetical protein